MGEDKTSFWTDIKQFEGVLERDPDSYAFVPLSGLYRKLGLFDDALSVAQRGCSRHPNLVAGQLALGLACHDLGLKDECRAALENVVRVTPENLDAQRILSRMYADAGEYAPAESALRIILALAPNDLESQVIQDALSRAKGAGESGAGSVFMAVDDTEQYGTDMAAPHFEEYLSDTEYQVGPSSADDLPSQEVFPAAFEAEAGDEEILDLDDACIIEELDDETEGGPEPGLEGTVPDQPPLVSATMAELYVKQGFNDLAIDVYRQLVAANPTDSGLLLRLDELLTAERSTSPVTQAVQPEVDVRQPFEPPAAVMGGESVLNEAVPHRQEAVAILEGWLESIRRVKACRSSIH